MTLLADRLSMIYDVDFDDNDMFIGIWMIPVNDAYDFVWVYNVDLND